MTKQHLWQLVWMVTIGQHSFQTVMAGQHSWQLNGHHQVVELLLKEKADPNIQDYEDWTALMAVSRKWSSSSG